MGDETRREKRGSMDLFEAMWRRKSCRKLSEDAFSADELAAIDEAVAGFDRLYPDVELHHQFFTKAKGKFGVKAPQYLMISGNGDPRDPESAGFLYEQLILWFDMNGIGSVWLGETCDAQVGSKGANDILAIGFGHSHESVHREPSGFKRNDIADMTNAPDDLRIQAVHVAPSGMNTQPWYLEAKGDEVLLYQRKLKPPVSLMYHHSDVDMGIGLCHYAVASKHEGKPFNFERTDDLPKRKGHKPFGIIR